MYFEGGSVGYSNGEISEHSECLVRLDAPESKVVRDFMDSQEKVLVGCAADGICNEHKKKGGRAQVSEADCCGKLEEDNREDDPFRQRLVAHKFRDLWVAWSVGACIGRRNSTHLGMSFHDGQSSGTMWLLCHQP